jgi:hypothetical protein
MMPALKLIPQLCCWTVLALLLLRRFPGRRTAVTLAGISGFALGVAGAVWLLRVYPGDSGFGLIRTALGAGFILFWFNAVFCLYQSGARGVAPSWRQRLTSSPLFAALCALTAGLLMGAVCACRLPSGGAQTFLLLCLAALLSLAALVAEKMLPVRFTVTQTGLNSAAVALMLFASSAIPRLDLFAPLSMKVSKFTHDFVHQFFESMLIPDHYFFNSFTWDFIGFFFSKEVGFWGALILWVVPLLLIILAIKLAPLPSVSHIRQGAERRRMIAATLVERRLSLVLPVFALLMVGSAVYESSNPSVEYWDPKPVPVSATPAGEIFIPRKGEIDLEDGKLHKYLFKRGGREARFFVLMTPAGQLTVALDACAICKPEGYGQAEGTVICYYCKTLIPLETVGKPGGCNPVPVRFTAGEDGVRIDGANLLNVWGETVQVTAQGKGGAN